MYNYILGLIKVTASSYNPQPMVEFVKHVYDVKSWLTPSIEELHGHTQPHCFKFFLSSEGHAVMHFKNWSHDAWSREPLLLLKVNNYYSIHNFKVHSLNNIIIIMQNIPEGSPQLLQPNLEKIDVHKLKQDIPKYDTWITRESAEEWHSILTSDFAEFTNVSCHHESWLLEVLIQHSSHDSETEQFLQEPVPAEEVECTVSDHCIL